MGPHHVLQTHRWATGNQGTSAMWQGWACFLSFFISQAAINGFYLITHRYNVHGLCMIPTR